MEGQTRMQGAIEVVTAALSGGVVTVERMHRAIARKPFSVLRIAPAVRAVSEAVRVMHDGIAGLTYGSIGASIALAGTAARRATAVMAIGDAEPMPGSLAGLAIAALNGFAGERLAQAGNPLASDMTLRHAGRVVPIERDALRASFPRASSRVAVFVHGLAVNEMSWRLYATRHYDDPDTTYGSRLERDLGYTPVYLRYNTGLHISDNGRRLSELVQQMIVAWPVPVEELILVGHSMGGLVVRSASHSGFQAGHEWVRRVRHVVCLGSPHHGAPLEKAANVFAWMLDRVDVTRPLAAVLNARSVGIKDLRFGSLLDEHWRGVDLDALLANRGDDVPLLDAAAHYFVGATVTRDRAHPMGVAIGDLLVREASALGTTSRRIRFPLENGRYFGAMNHLELLNHPDVYEQIRRWLEGRAAELPA
jgi:pimeloyl-ACP methyl ester carboxylesterase